MNYPLLITVLIKLVLITALVAVCGFGLVACGDAKKDEDVAAIRQMMEEKKAQEEAAKRKDAEAFEEIKRKNAQTRKELGI